MKLVILILMFSFITGCSGDAGPEQSPIFISGTKGYHTYRIPALAITLKGTILAFCEGRKNKQSDTGDIDLLLRRSEDGGRTWSKQQVVFDDGNNVCGNPSPVIDRETGVIWLLMTWNHSDDEEEAIITHNSRDTRRVFVTSSDDDGKSWAVPRDITISTKNPRWGWYATGPGHGIQIKKGLHKGRLVIPCDHSYDDPAGTLGGGPYEYGSHTIYSDDHGETWNMGGVIRPKVNECQVVEIDDGSGTLLMNMRSYFGRNRRTQSVSSDGGTTWSEPKDVVELVEPVCQAAIIRLTAAEHGDKSRILFSNPSSIERERLTIKMSYDEGRTWPVSRMLNAGPSAYSDLAVSSRNEIYCLYENGDKSAYERITLAQFDLTWLVNEN